MSRDVPQRPFCINSEYSPCEITRSPPLSLFYLVSTHSQVPSGPPLSTRIILDYRVPRCSRRFTRCSRQLTRCLARTVVPSHRYGRHSRALCFPPWSRFYAAPFSAYSLTLAFPPPQNSVPPRPLLVCATLFHRLFVSRVHSFLTYSIRRLVRGARHRLARWFLRKIARTARDTSDPY